MDTFTLTEIEAAARHIGLDGKTSALLAALREAAESVTLPGNARDEVQRYQDMAEGLRSLYAQLGTWRAVGEAVGLSKPYVWRVAHGDLVPSPEALARYQAYSSQTDDE